MRVLVVSDTHLRSGAGLPDSVLELADRADHVVHGGDWVTADVVTTLRALGPVTGVRGNVDDAETAAVLPEVAEVELGGVRFAVLHDAGPAAGRHERLAARFPSADVVVYGHSHMPELTWVERAGSVGARPLLVLNPGSPVQRRRAPTHTVAWLEIAGGVVASAELVDLDATGTSTIAQ